jgi:hypothetical protein
LNSPNPAPPIARRTTQDRDDLALVEVAGGRKVKACQTASTGSRAATVLRQVIAAGQPVAHDLLDELPHGSPVNQARHLIVHSGLCRRVRPIE